MCGTGRWRQGRTAKGPLPDVDFGLIGVDAAERLVHVTVHRQTLLAFPAAHGADPPLQIGGNLLPRIETVSRLLGHTVILKLAKGIEIRSRPKWAIGSTATFVALAHLPQARSF
jgi:hypothetical protein